jgi:hypothetical protein
MLRADNFEQATGEAHDMVSPLLSWWSTKYDVGIALAGFAVREVITDSVRINVGLLGSPRQLGETIEAFVSRPDYRHLFSAYREGLTSTNLFHQALAFYKVIEGFWRLRDKARADGTDTSRGRPERFPSDEESLGRLDPWALESLRPCLGRKFSDVVQKDLREPIRNAVAHLDPTGKPLTADVFSDVSQCERIIPVLKWMARNLLQSAITRLASPGNDAP